MKSSTVGLKIIYFGVEIIPGSKGTIVVQWNDIWTSIDKNPPEFLYTGILFGTPENLVGTGGYLGLMSLTDNVDGTLTSIFQEPSIPNVDNGNAYYQQGKLIPWDGNEITI
jgi:hypothetical protein